MCFKQKSSQQFILQNKYFLSVILYNSRSLQKIGLPLLFRKIHVNQESYCSAAIFCDYLKCDFMYV